MPIAIDRKKTLHGSFLNCKTPDLQTASFAVEVRGRSSGAVARLGPLGLGSEEDVVIPLAVPVLAPGGLHDARGADELTVLVEVASLLAVVEDPSADVPGADHVRAQDEGDDLPLGFAVLPLCLSVVLAAALLRLVRLLSRGHPDPLLAELRQEAAIDVDLLDAHVSGDPLGRVGDRKSVV